MIELHTGDCRDVMGAMDADSVDTIITDPPYGLEFMGKDWDHGVPGFCFWQAALRVAKPGAHLLAFGGTRTHHRLMVAIEDAGWEIRDVVMWVYGSGFPKSLNIGKALDKAAGAEREVVGINPHSSPGRKPGVMHIAGGNARPEMERRMAENGYDKPPITAPATDAARAWDGWGTALKPAWEPIIVAMKPLAGTFAENALRYGVAGLWVDGGRVDFVSEADKGDPNRFHGPNGGAFLASDPSRTSVGANGGRWPANVIHDGSDEVLAGFPDRKSKPYVWENDRQNQPNIYGAGKGIPFDKDAMTGGFSDTGSAARFFYCAKASRSERNAGLEGMEERERNTLNDYARPSEGRTAPKATGAPQSNHHPTVKPLALMRYLCRLTRTPTGGVVFDPFMGSGSTGCAAVLEGRSFIGIDQEAEYVEIARRRISYWQGQHTPADNSDLPLFSQED